MARPGAIFRVLAIALGLSSAGCVTTGSVATTFDRADVRIVGNMVARYELDLRAAYARARQAAEDGELPNFSGSRLAELSAKIAPGDRPPVIVYFHGCAGIRIASRDPWFVRYATQCCDYVLAHANGTSIYEADSRSHNLMTGHWPAVAGFLQRHRR